MERLAGLNLAERDPQFLKELLVYPPPLWPTHSPREKSNVVRRLTLYDFLR
jgi:hypothetical protein